MENNVQNNINIGTKYLSVLLEKCLLIIIAIVSSPIFLYKKKV